MGGCNVQAESKVQGARSKVQTCPPRIGGPVAGQVDLQLGVAIAAGLEAEHIELVVACTKAAPLINFFTPFSCIVV